MPTSSDAEPSSAAGPPTAVEALRQVAALLDSGEAHAALVASRDLFARGDLPEPRVADLCDLAAMAALALGLEPVSEQMWRQAIAREPGRIDALLKLGGLLARQQRHAEAKACYHQALRSDRRSVATLADLGALLTTLKRHGEAESRLREALAISPGDPRALTNLALLMVALERGDEAERAYAQALASPRLDPPTRSIVTSNLGNLLADIGRDDEAERCLREAVALDPASAVAACNLGVLLRERDRPEEAEACFRQAIAQRPRYWLAQLHLSALLLAQGAYVEGWRLHEARHHSELLGNGIPPPPYAMPRWQGEPLAGRSILVWPEQGLGDQIQFARFAALLKARGAARVTWVCQRPLKALFETLDGADEVIAAEIVDNRFIVPGRDLSQHDLWAFPLGLPQALGTRLESVPASVPYLHAPADRQALWTARLPGDAGRMRVGLVWRGNPKHENDSERSLPGLATLAPLWSVPRIDFVSLQSGSAGEAARTPPPGQPLLHLGDDLRDFADTAAVVARLDLLICVDTSVAHLAGALGRPCWLLLPRHKTDWRWLRHRADSPWYPSLRLFRQARRGEWGPTVDAVGDALRQACVTRSNTADGCSG